MQLDINLTDEQVLLLASKLGYKAQIEDTTQGLVGDSYPLIDNPVTLEQFASATITEVLLSQVQDKIRTGIQVVITNIFNQAQEKVARGDYDDALMTLPTEQILALIISELVV